MENIYDECPIHQVVILAGNNRYPVEGDCPVCDYELDNLL